MPWHEWISDMKVTVMNLAIWLLSLSWAAPRRPGGLARQHQLRGVREDGDERVGGRVTSIAPKVTKAIKRRMNRTLHKSQNNHSVSASHTFRKLTCSARVLFLIVLPLLHIDENILLGTYNLKLCTLLQILYELPPRCWIKYQRQFGNSYDHDGRLYFQMGFAHYIH